MNDDERVERLDCSSTLAVRYEGLLCWMAVYVSEMILYSILGSILSQWRDLRIGLIWENRGVLVTALASEFWMTCV